MSAPTEAEIMAWVEGLDPDARRILDHLMDGLMTRTQIAAWEDAAERIAKLAQEHAANDRPTASRHTRAVLDRLQSAIRGARSAAFGPSSGGLH